MLSSYCNFRFTRSPVSNKAGLFAPDSRMEPSLSATTRLSDARMCYSANLCHAHVFSAHPFMRACDHTTLKCARIRCGIRECSGKDSTHLLWLFRRIVQGLAGMLLIKKTVVAAPEYSGLQPNQTRTVLCGRAEIPRLRQILTLGMYQSKH